jgi:hypothetical protein
MSKGRQGVLRRIAVHVEETKSGGFEWVLSSDDNDNDNDNGTDDEDEDAGPWRPFKRARKAVETYKASMADGLLALQSLIDDLDAGPRRPADIAPDSKAVRTGRAAKSESEKKPATGSAFGFGLMK